MLCPTLTGLTQLSHAIAKVTVEQELQQRIGRQWVLKCVTPKERPKNITLRGREYPYVVKSDDGLEKTIFIEVEL